jgi:hypothetical protein
LDGFAAGVRQQQGITRSDADAEQLVRAARLPSDACPFLVRKRPENR